MYYLDFSYMLEYRRFKKEKIIPKNNGYDYYPNDEKAKEAELEYEGDS